MNHIAIALGIGVLAGIFDIIPMLLSPMAKNNKMYKYSMASVFAQWVLLGLIIPFVAWPILPWVKGAILGAVGMMPTAILTYARLKIKFIAFRVIIHGAIFGAVIGWVTSFLIY